MRARAATHSDGAAGFGLGAGKDAGTKEACEANVAEGAATHERHDMGAATWGAAEGAAVVGDALREGARVSAGDKSSTGTGAAGAGRLLRISWAHTQHTRRRAF